MGPEGRPLDGPLLQTHAQHGRSSPLAPSPALGRTRPRNGSSCQFALPLPRSRRRCWVVQARARDSREPGRRARSIVNPSIAAQQVPVQLLRSDYAERQEHAEVPLTVYSCRIQTGFGRGAALSDPNSSGVNLCLLGKDGRAVMHRISPVNDPTEARHEVELMCQVIDDESVGADCRATLGQDGAQAGSPSLSPPIHGTHRPLSSTRSPVPTPAAPPASAYTLPPKPPPAPRLRFQEGAVDEIVFLAPELGPLSGVLVGTETGTWVMDELQVASSRTHHIDRFVCRKQLGGQPGQGAALLSPVPPDVVIYGTGDAQVALSKEQAAALHTLNMEAYEALKQRMLTTTVLLTASGSWVAGLAAGLDGAIPFAMGGMAGVAYQWLLQQGVDNIVSTVATSHAPHHTTTPAVPRMRSMTAASPAPGAHKDKSNHAEEVEFRAGGVRTAVADLLHAPRVRRAVSSPAARVAFLAAATAATMSVLGVVPEEGLTNLPAAAEEIEQGQLWQLLVALLGFMTYKVALVSVSLSTPVAADLVRVHDLNTSSTAGGQR